MKLKRWSPVVLGAILVAVFGLGSPGTAEQPLPPSGDSQAGAKAGPIPVTARVRHLSVEKGANVTTVMVHASGPLSYQTQMLSNPTRLVVDLPDTILLARQRRIAIDAESVVGVRSAQFKAHPPVTRLVVDLLQEVNYQIEAIPRGLKLTLRHPTSSAPSLAAAPVSEPAPETPVLVASLAPVVPAGTAAEPSEALVLSTVAPSVSLPAAKPVESETLAPSTTATAQAPPPGPPTSQQPQAPPAAPTAAPAQPRAPTPTRYTGEPISVNLKDVDLKDFFRLIHEISGLNIVLDPAVSGAVTLVLDEVPWDQALDIVLRNNSLGKELEGNVLRIAALSTLKKEEEDRRDLAKARVEAATPELFTRRLSYAKAEQLEPVLRKFLTGQGDIIRDDRTNTLLIREIPEAFPRIADLITQLDRKSPQVEIEARVVLASRSFLREFGTQLAMSNSWGVRPSGFGTDVGGVGVLGDQGQFTRGGILTPRLNTATTGNPPLVWSLPATNVTSGLSVSIDEIGLTLDLILTAAEKRGIGKILSRPRVITQNNVLAHVQQGLKIPFQTVVNNTITITFINVTLSLRVTPQITVEGTVFLNVDIENTDINPGIPRIAGMPALNTQQTTTQVLVNDGGTVVIGGVMVNKTQFNVDQVPLLGSVPIIGHLFKHTLVTTSSDELIFFITPRILPT